MPQNSCVFGKLELTGSNELFCWDYHSSRTVMDPHAPATSNITGDDGLRHVAPIGEAGCGTGGTQWCARHVGSQGQVSSPPGFRLHRHLLMPPLFVLFHFSRTAVVCCACPASRSDRGVLSGCGGLARLTRPVARPGRLTARVPTSLASFDAPIFFLCHSTSTAVVCCLLPCRPL